MMSDSQSEVIDERCDFGKMLSEARKAQNFSISEINEYIKVSEDVISAIESCDMAVLPASTFTQGYLRAYARFLDISEEKVLHAYQRALPGNSAAELRPNPNRSDITWDQSPWIKMVTVLLITVGVAALIYGGVQYYQKKADVMDAELESKERGFTGNSLDSPGSQPLEINQDAYLTDEGELVLEQGDTSDLMDEESEVAAALSDQGKVVPEQAGKQENEVVTSRMEQAAADPGEDVIKFFAQQGSWMEVQDANNVRLFYNTLPEGARRSFKGLAPFRVFMGNAESTTVEINNIEVDIRGRIRSNNTARFKVSSEQQKVIFH